MTKLSKAQRAKFDHVIGSRRQVFNGSAHHTSGGLEKSDLMMSKNGRIVSKKKHMTAKKEKRLVKAGYGAEKGKFGFVLLKKKGKKTAKRSKKMKGGFSGHLPLAPANFEGEAAAMAEPVMEEVADAGKEMESSVDVQEEAGQAGGKRRHTRRRRGGHSNIDMALSPTPYDGQGVGTSGVGLQIVAGQAGGKRRRTRRKH